MTPLDLYLKEAIDLLQANGYEVIKICTYEGTQREKVIELLKTGWYSGYALDLAIQSTGGAPRAVELKTNPHIGWKLIERKHANGKCQEYHLIPDEASEINIKTDNKGQVKMFDTKVFV